MSWMLTAILICGCKQEAPLTFQAGTYEVTAQGHNGDIRLGGNALTEILVSGRIAATSVTLERPQGAPSVNSLDGLPDGIYIVNGKKMLKK